MFRSTISEVRSIMLFMMKVALVLLFIYLFGRIMVAAVIIASYYIGIIMLLVIGIALVRYFKRCDEWGKSSLFYFILREGLVNELFNWK